MVGHGGVRSRLIGSGMAGNAQHGAVRLSAAWQARRGSVCFGPVRARTGWARHGRHGRTRLGSALVRQKIGNAGMVYRDAVWHGGMERGLAGVVTIRFGGVGRGSSRLGKARQAKISE
jgi:hypothetical protein